MNISRAGLACLVAMAISANVSLPANAQDKTPIKLTLDWKYQGIHAFVFWAQKKGYFASENLDVQIDQGSGSAATVSKIASGAYDAGLGDVNAIIQLAGTKPGTQPVMVYMLYNRPPFALIAKTSSPVKSLKDMPGRKLGFPAGAAAGQLFPALAKVNGIDASKVDIVNMAPSLQEQMLLNNQVDACAVFSVTSYINLVGQKVDPDKDIRWMFYSDNGIDLYSNGVMVSQRLLKEKPQAVKGLVAALNRALIETAADPTAAVAMLVEIEPLLDANLERQRLVYAIKSHFVSPETDEIGIGDVKDTKMQSAIALMSEVSALPAVPKVGDVFDHSFLPDRTSRVLKLTN